MADAEIIIEHLKKVLQKLKKSERDAIHYYRKKKIEPPEPTWISDVWINRFDGKLRKVKK